MIVINLQTNSFKIWIMNYECTQKHILNKTYTGLYTTLYFIYNHQQHIITDQLQLQNTNKQTITILIISINLFIILLLIHNYYY